MFSPSSPADAAGPPARRAILDAALDCFTAEGFGSSVRRIAGRAGVSAALVIHHFGSKDHLRRACDDHALAVLTRKGDHPDLESAAAAIAPAVRYAARVLVDGGAAADRFFDVLVNRARRELPTADEASAVALAAYSLAPALLGSVIARRFGREELDEHVLLRLQEGFRGAAPVLVAEAVS